MAIDEARHDVATGHVHDAIGRRDTHGDRRHSPTVDAQVLLADTEDVAAFQHEACAAATRVERIAAAAARASRGLRRELRVWSGSDALGGLLVRRARRAAAQ